MNKIIITIIVIIVLIGGYYAFTNQSPAVSSNMPAPGNASTTEMVVATSTSQIAPLVIDMKSGGFYFKPNIIKAKVGQPITVNVDTAGGMHTFTVDEFNVDVQTPGGKITSVTFTPTKTGSFEFYCAIAGHRAKGQFGTLIVE